MWKVGCGSVHLRAGAIRGRDRRIPGTATLAKTGSSRFNERAWLKNKGWKVTGTDLVQASGLHTHMHRQAYVYTHVQHMYTHVYNTCMHTHMYIHTVDYMEKCNSNVYASPVTCYLYSLSSLFLVLRRMQLLHPSSPQMGTLPSRCH